MNNADLLVNITVEYSCLVSQMVKNLPAMQETQVRSLGQEDPLEKGMVTHSRGEGRGGGERNHVQLFVTP